MEQAQAPLPEALAVAGDLHRSGIVPEETSFSGFLINKISRAVSTMQYGKLSTRAEFCSQWLRHAALAIGYSVLTDFAYDEKLPPGREVRVHQAASYLLATLIEEICRFYRGDIASLVLNTLSNHSRYHIVEHKWDHPEEFASIVDLSSYHIKQAMYLLPAELFEAHGSASVLPLARNYFIYQLLADDLSDFNDDVNQGQISYAVMKYFQKHGRMPSNEIAKQEVFALISHELEIVAAQVRDAAMRVDRDLGHYADGVLSQMASLDRIIYRA